MTEVKKYRRLEDGVVIEAVQYGRPGIMAPVTVMMYVAKFVLGFDADAHISVLNERMLDVIIPSKKRWRPDEGVADIWVVDPRGGGMKHRLELGDWVARTRKDGPLICIENWALETQYEEVLPEPPRTEVDDLADLIYDVFPWEGETYQAVAENVAAKLIRAGWSRKEKSS